MAEENSFRESRVPWLNEELSTQSTTIPELIVAESKQLATVVIFVISAILAITLLFLIAIFIDCRHQKIKKTKLIPKRKNFRLKLPIPNIGQTIQEEDEDTIVDKMQQPEPSSNGIV